MKKIHQHFASKYAWYAKWHNHPHHGLTHALVLTIIIATGLSQALKIEAAPATQANSNATYNPNNRKGGLLPDDPKKIRAVPRLVATKDPKSVKLEQGESLVTVAPLAALPTVVNLATPPVLNQGSEGACVGFSVVTARSIEEYYYTGALSYNVATNVFSPEHLYNDIIFGADCQSGSAMQTALDSLKAKGVSTLQSMPFSATNGCQSFPNPEQTIEAAGFKIGSYARILSTDRETMKTMVANNHPVIVNVLADNSFINATPGFIWKQYSGSGSLPHAITIVGYDDAKNAWKIQNSWGTTWGDAGFGWIDYDFFLTRTGTYVYVIDSLPAKETVKPTVAITSPTGGSFSGVTTLSATASDNVAIAGVRFRIDGVTVGVEDTTAPYTLDWNMSALAAGTHTITAVARDTAGNLAVSSPVTISVTTGDTTVPTSASVVSPRAGDTIAGLASVVLAGVDNGAVKEIQLLVNGKPWLVALPPFETILRTLYAGTTFLGDGSYTITPIAKDFANNTKTGTAQTVVISNPPSISGINNLFPIPATSITIVWTTNKPADSQVFYGTTTALGSSTTFDPTLVTNHSVLISGLTPGTKYYYQVKSKNALGTGVATSSIYSFTTATSGGETDTIAPTVSLSAPSAGATVSATTTVSATASDNVGVVRVEFFRDGYFIAADTTAPYSVSWDTTTASNSTIPLTAKAYDAAGNVTTSSPVSVTVNNTVPDTTAPTVSITTPTAGSTLSGTVAITVSATDTSGVDHVDFYRGTTLIGAAASAPFTMNWNTETIPNGTYSLTARAYDTAGNGGVSTAVSVSVNNIVPPPVDTTAPTVSVTYPANGATVSGVVTLIASASDANGVTKVSFFNGTTLIDTDTTGSPSFAITWDTNSLPAGSYSITAKAYDPSNNVGTSSAITVSVSDDRTAPTVAITSPANGAKFKKGATVSIAATATDASGVSRVVFNSVSGTTVTTLCTDTLAPYACSWKLPNSPNKTYTIEAIGYDPIGNAAKASVSISSTR